MTLQTIALVFLVTMSVGGVAWVFLYPMLSGEKAAEERFGSVVRAEPARKASARSPQRARREQVEETLKEIEARGRKVNRPSLSARIARAGLDWSKRKFVTISIVLGVSVFALVFLAGGGLLPALGLGFGAGAGLPNWLLSFLRKRREAKFLEHFPDAVDVIVRGIKAGLPLFDSMKVIVLDSEEPIRSEFRAILETQTVGMPLGEACGRLYERIPLPEANFFGIVVAIQQQAGGNLSEALGNLSRVLRDRKKMKEKIKAMSMEAKASATIIGALPPVVMLTVYITSPNYISLLWTHPTGHVLLACSAAWMAAGVLVMKKMITFDF
ncbi:type II secretion system F family protein [Rhodoplanes sp. TEM]|uniref:Type II secretion system F family protein n=1 Tax=Rhodoplanes tepidamans TaxID=200616 RepID=A0ABT5J8P4_RHOTP|nr:MULTISPECIES: type II secretion system F family protein [Rhodoplanes]MDC7785766.1 type II secretion system F family protein [Rhodoplanes tepidamans]MDC7984033.1 type II secretion system F family protein [Rhodoplanes sp. TEM]MDQ0354672.1 tight adherence protein B [Rhodoplanes tepidamans]